MATQFDPNDLRNQAKFDVQEASFGVRGSALTVIAAVAIGALAYCGWLFFQSEQFHYLFDVAVMLLAIAGFATHKAGSHATSSKAGSDSAADARYDGSSSGEP